MQTIYLDVLLILNLYVNWFLLRGTARLTHTRLHTVRCIAAALCGSFTSLTVLLPPMPTVLALAVKLLTAMLPVGIAFGMRRIRIFLRCLAVFVCVSFAFAGLMLALCTLSETDLLIWSGSCIYLHFSPVVLILCTAVSYFLLRLASFIRLRFHHADENYEVIIRVGAHLARQAGLADTGNSLADCFTGLPVIIFGMNALRTLPQMQSPETLPHYRLLPYATVSSSSNMPVFHPDEVLIHSLSTGKTYHADALIGIAAQHQNVAIFNPNLLHVL